SGSRCRTSSSRLSRRPSPASGATPRPARPSPRRSAPAPRSTCRCSSASATSSRSTRARANTWSGSVAPSGGVLGDRRAVLEARARILRAVRGYFEGEGFLEVETPARVPSPGQEVHLDAVATGDRWLITSPEYHMKRLVAAGYERIFQVGKAWRAGEVGA